MTMDTNENRRPTSRELSAAPAAATLRRRRRNTQKTAIRPADRNRRLRKSEPRQEVPAVTRPKAPARGRLLLKLGITAAVVAAIFLGLSLIFQVETITVAGTDKYAPWMVRQASGLEEGASLLTVSEARVASRIISQLPYVDQVKVSIRFPDTVQIELTELQVTYSVADETGQWWLISSSGRAVEPVDRQTAYKYTRAEGLTIQPPQKGEPVTVAEGVRDNLAALVSIMEALEENRVIGRVAYIDVADLRELRLVYPGLLTVRLGKAERMGHKIGYMTAALEQLTENISGLLDVSLEDSQKGIFTPAG